MASIQSNLAKYFVRQLRTKGLKYMEDLDRLRVEQDRALSRIRPPRNVTFGNTRIYHMEAEWAYPSVQHQQYNDHVILFLHGGGYAVGSPWAYRGLTGKFAAELGIKALTIDYRLAPEHPYPAALIDAVTAYRWLVEDGNYLPNKIIIMGDSAGGGLTLATLLKLQEEKLPQPLAAVAMSPWIDLTLSGDTIQTHQDKDPLLLAEQAKKWAKWYHGKHDPQNPLISPLFGNFSEVAPILIHVGTDEILLSDSLRIIDVAKKQDASIKVDIWDSMMHVWHFGWPYVPESRKAIIEIADFVEQQIVPDESHHNRGEITADKQNHDDDPDSWLRFGSDMLRNFFDTNK